MNTYKNDMKYLGRLKRRSDFLRVQKSGRKWVTRHFVVQMDDGAAPQNRFGVTVTKRLEKSAVRRNLMKRRLRAVTYDVLADEDKSRSRFDVTRDFVLIARKGLAEATYEDLKKDLRWCLKKLSIGADLAS